MNETESGTNISIKQRLVGAVVLVSLAVIFIPMILDGDGPFKIGKSKTFIPDEPRFEFETPGNTVTSALSIPAAIPAATPLVTNESTNNPTKTAGSIVAKEDLHSDLTDKNVTIVDAIFSESISKKALLAKTKIKNSTGDTSDDVMPAPVVEKTKAEKTKAEKKVKVATPKKIAKTKPRISKPRSKIAALKKNKHKTVKAWAVQLGSFKTKPNALRLRDKLRVKGFPSYVDEVSSKKGARYRVRVGPEIKRANAVKLKKHLAKVEKLEGLVVSH